ncbi:MAG: esterase-like activity of phytase family protein [Kiloniellales bacterium]
MRLFRTLYLLSLAGWLGAAPALPSQAEPLELSIVQRGLDPAQPDLTRVGRLEFRGALEITSKHPDFGGLSALEVDSQGRAFMAVSDRGHWVSGTLTYDERGWLSGLEDAEIGPLLDPLGGRLEHKAVQDAEALALLPDGSLLVAFERWHRIWRYAGSPMPLAEPPTSWPTPDGLEALPDNYGIEAMTALADGAVLAIAETETETGRFPAWLWRDCAEQSHAQRCGDWQRLSYRRTGAYRPSGAALLPDGDLLVLERRFSWLGGLAARLVRVPATAVAPGALLEGEELAVLTPPLLTDNWEGVSAATGPDGETLIYLVSDDNFMPLLRNLVALFVLPR